MDPTRFDRLAQSLGRATSRRTTLAPLLAGLLAGVPGPDVSAKGSRHRRSEHRKTQRDRKPDKGSRATAAAVPATCCAGGSCTPGAGKNLTRCCFEGRNLARANFRGANLSGASFRGAILTNADFRAANLTDVCLVDADIRGARFGAANRSGVIRCRTKTDTGIDNSGCARGTACCPTDLGSPQVCIGPGDCGDEQCLTKSCVSGECEYSVVLDGPSPNGLCGTHCCGGACCTNAFSCNPQGGCCVPSCGNRVCGPNGCGGNCGTCPTGTACDAGSGQCLSTCNPRNCPNGCCDAEGNCRPGTSVQSCGKGGAACASCSDTQTCQSGQCAACGPGSCTCAGQSICADPNGGNVFCASDCTCVVSVEGRPFCARSFDASDSCSSDADCTFLEHDAVCTRPGNAPGNPCPGQRFCALACRGKSGVRATGPVAVEQAAETARE